jgi:hypothetical protein
MYHASRLRPYFNHHGKEEQQIEIWGVVKQRSHGEQIEAAVPLLGLT